MYRAPPTPAMTPPQDGTLSVGIAKTDYFVWVWVLITETTKQKLSTVLEEPVDVWPLDLEEAKRLAQESTTNTLSHSIYTDEDRADFRRHAAESAKDFFKAKPILLRQYIDGPLRYPIKSAQEAAEYTERLKTTVFPKIKAMIQAQGQPSSESFQV